MSDFNSSLPVRTESAGDVVVKIGDATTPSQQISVDASGRITVRLTDGSGNSINSTSNALNVNVTNGLSTGVADKTAFTYGTTVETVMGGVFQDTSPTLTAGTQGALRLTTNRGLHINLRDASGNEKLGSSTSANSIPVVIASDQGALAVTQSGTWTVQPGNTANTTAWLVTDLADGSSTGGTAGTKSLLAGLVFNTSAPTLTTGQQAGLQADSSANLLVNLKTAIPAGGNVIGAVTQSGTWTAAQGSANTATNGWPVKLTDGTNVGAVKAASTAAIATDPSVVVGLSPNSPIPTGTNNIGNVGVLVGGAANSITNPLFVSTTDASGTPVISYQTSAALAAAGTANLDYTVTAAKTFYSQQVWATASGKIKVVVGYETGVASGTFNTFWVGFNSTANPNICIPLPPSKTQIAGAKIRVSITNEDKAAMDVYETLSGTEQ